MDEIETLLVDVRASTQGFASDIAQMRSAFDSTLTDGFAKAGSVLESGLLNAVRKGSLGFEDLERVALKTIDRIAAQALQLGLDTLLGGGAGGGGASGAVGGILGSVVGGLLGLPGRATGGPVSPGRGYLVGERGPELFVPTSAGRVETGLPGGGIGSGGRDVKVSIALAAPRGTAAPVALQRSGRQVASAISRALREG
ncbi:tail tape measure protein [Tsuneonella suprasediminis]|uniref:tail tape measure protein n=1 Tax=Tsuneonella suprasediminis TaxID=2306996 RepID=UPI002F92DB59